LLKRSRYSENPIDSKKEEDQTCRVSQVHTFVQIEKAVIGRNNSSICGKVKQQEPQQEYESIDKKGGEDNNHDNSIVVLKEMVHSRKQID